MAAFAVGERQRREFKDGWAGTEGAGAFRLLNREHRRRGFQPRRRLQDDWVLDRPVVVGLPKNRGTPRWWRRDWRGLDFDECSAGMIRSLRSCESEFR